MKTEVGEYIVGAYLKIIEECDVVSYNVRPPGGGLKGLGELDVIGLRFKDNTAFLCEVTTHILGLLYKNKEYTVKKIMEKHERQKEYGEQYLKGFSKRYLFWSPFVNAEISQGIAGIKGLELKINSQYAHCIWKLQEKAGKLTNDEGNPFFRMLQIMKCVERYNSEKPINSIKGNAQTNRQVCEQDCKSQLRELYSLPKVAYTKEELIAETNRKWITLSTALSDLKNPKYSGKQGTTLHIKKDDDGKYRVIEA